MAFLLINKNVEIGHYHILPTLDLGRHRKFESFPNILGYWTVTAGPQYVTLDIWIKWSGLISNSRDSKMFVYSGFHSLPETKFYTNGKKKPRTIKFATIFSI